MESEKQNNIDHRSETPLNFLHAVQLSSAFRFHVDQLHQCIPVACVTFDVAVVPDSRVVVLLFYILIYVPATTAGPLTI